MSLSPILVDLFYSVALVVVSGLFLGALSQLLQTVVRRAGARAITLRGIRDWFSILWLALSGLGLVWVWGYASYLTVLTVSGIAGLAITLALQAMLTNMISGFLLVRDGALRVGDRIEYSGIKGEVIRIALRNTWVRTEAGSVAIIGNTSLAGGPLTNHSAALRMSEELVPPSASRRQGSSNGPRMPAP